MTPNLLLLAGDSGGEVDKMARWGVKAAAGARSRGFLHGQGAKLRCARWLPYAKTEGEMGGPLHGARGRNERGGGENLAVWARRVEDEGPGG
jgi:hypothetical protein